MFRGLITSSTSPLPSSILHQPSVACPCGMFERIFCIQFGYLAHFRLVIWRIFIWSFGGFSFGHLAHFHLVIWLLTPSAFGSFILTKRFSFSFWFSFNFLISSPLTSYLWPLTSEKMCPVFQHHHFRLCIPPLNGSHIIMSLLWCKAVHRLHLLTTY